MSYLNNINNISIALIVIFILFITLHYYKKTSTNISTPIEYKSLYIEPISKTSYTESVSKPIDIKYISKIISIEPVSIPTPSIHNPIITDNSISQVYYPINTNDQISKDKADVDRQFIIDLNNNNVEDSITIMDKLILMERELYSERSDLYIDNEIKIRVPSIYDYEYNNKLNNSYNLHITERDSFLLNNKNKLTDLAKRDCYGPDIYGNYKYMDYKCVFTDRCEYGYEIKNGKCVMKYDDTNNSQEYWKSDKELVRTLRYIDSKALNKLNDIKRMKLLRSINDPELINAQNQYKNIITERDRFLLENKNILTGLDNIACSGIDISGMYSYKNNACVREI